MEPLTTLIGAPFAIVFATTNEFVIITEFIIIGEFAVIIIFVISGDLIVTMRDLIRSHQV